MPREQGYTTFSDKTHDLIYSFEDDYIHGSFSNTSCEIDKGTVALSSTFQGWKRYACFQNPSRLTLGDLDKLSGLAYTSAEWRIRIMRGGGR